MPAPSGPIRRVAPLVALVGLVALALFSLGGHLRVALRTPDELQWFAAAKEVREDLVDGDVVRIEPAWATEGLRFLRDLPVDLVEEPELRRLQHYRRLWVLAGFGHDCMEGAVPGARPIRSSEHGELTTCLFELPYRGAPLYDFRERLKDAQVRRRRKRGGFEECRLWARSGEWHCGKVHSWQFVGPVIKDVDDSPREALWAHPLPDGARLIIVYPAVPMGKELDLSAGLTLRSIHSGEGTDVHFQVRIDGNVVLERTLAPTQKGWFHWPIDTSKQAGQVLPVTFTIWARDNQVRQLLFDGRVWER